VPIYSRRMDTAERLKIAAEKSTPQILRSQARPGVLLLMAWMRPDGIAEAIAASGAGLVIAAECHTLSEVPSLRRVARGDGPARDGVTLISENHQQDALQSHLEHDGWLLSPDGALAAAAAWKLVSEAGGKTALVLDFVSPLTEAAEVARLLGIKLTVKLPAGTRVGGIIIPQ
jgi:hypothetical protein